MKPKHYYMFNKPYGCVSARTDDTYPTVMDYFKELNNPDLSPVGRLDLETEGLLFITDDGQWNQRMTHPDHQKEKLYEFIALGTPDEEKIRRLEAGILLRGSDKKTKPCSITIDRIGTLEEFQTECPEKIREAGRNNRPSHPAFFGTITVSEGRKRQIRRMFKTEKCLIMYLKRISMDGICLDPDLRPGEWKEIFLSDYKL